MSGSLDDLVGVLEEGKRRGLLGPGPVEPQIEHALALGSVVPAALRAATALDLGTGGGLPGLVLAAVWPDSRWTLLDSRVRSVRFVEEMAGRLGLADRVVGVLARAEDVGRDPAHRAAYELVVARGFGPPAVTAECAAPLLHVSGRLVVSEPPGSTGSRWPEDTLEGLGLRFRAVQQLEAATAMVLEQVKLCPSTFPRRIGVPAKRPLF